MSLRHSTNGVWIQAIDSKAVIQVIDPTTGEPITNVAAGATEGVHTAVLAAVEAYKGVWGLNCPGTTCGLLLNILADLVEEHVNGLAAIEALNVG